MKPETVDALAVRVAAHLGRPGDDTTTDQARAHVPIVTAFCHGYTRGNGFDVESDPAADVESVIVAATARLTANPEQVAMYSAADYSERPAVFTGWTIAEQFVLHRYRRRWA